MDKGHWCKNCANTMTEDGREYCPACQRLVNEIDSLKARVAELEDAAFRTAEVMTYRFEYRTPIIPRGYAQGD